MNAKRIFGSALLVATALAGMNLCAAVESGVVGYTTVELKPGFNMIAVNFEDLTDSEGISIQELFPGTTAGLTGGTLETGDKIMIYSEGTYTTHYLYHTSVPIPALQANNGKWIDGTTPSTHKFRNGDAFWYNLVGTEPVSISIAGAVSVVAEQEINIVPGFNMLGGAFPTTFNPNSLGTEFWANSGATGGTLETGDKIMVYSEGAYTTYYLYYSSVPVPALQANNWKWIKGTAPVDVSEEVLAVGKGVWYNHNGEGFTLSLENPIAE